MVEFVIVVPSLMSLSLPFLSSMQSYMAFSSSLLLSYVSTLPFRRRFLSYQCRCYGHSCQRQVVADVISTARLRRFRHCCRHRDCSCRRCRICSWQLCRFVRVRCCSRGRICHRCAVANVVVVAIFVLNAVVYGVFIVILVVICVNFAVSWSFFAVSVPLLWS